MGQTKIFITIVSFYIILFGLMGFVSQDDITISYGDNYTTDTWVSSIPIVGLAVDDFLTPVQTYFQKMKTTVTGLPAIFNILLFLPLGAIVIFWFIKFVVGLVHGDNS